MNSIAFIGPHSLIHCLITNGRPTRSADGSIVSTARPGEGNPSALGRLWYWCAALMIDLLCCVLVHDRPSRRANKSTESTEMPAQPQSAVMVTWVRRWFGFLLLVGVCMLFKSSTVPMCKLFGPSGLVCTIATRGCLLPRWVCADLFTSTRGLGSRTGLATVVAVNTRSRAITDFIIGSRDFMKTYGYDNRNGFAAVYRNMERTRQQSDKTRMKGMDLLDAIPETAAFVERELGVIRIRASAIQRYFSEEPEQIVPFLRSLDKSLHEIINVIDSETRTWEEFKGDIKLLLGYGNDLLDGLTRLLSVGEVGQILRRAEVLDPLTVTASDRLMGGAISAGAAVCSTIVACAFFPPACALTVAGPVASTLTFSFSVIAYKHAQASDAQYYKMDLAHTHMETIIGTMRDSLPDYLESVDKSAKRVRNVVHELMALRQELGEAESERLQMIENKQATRTAIKKFIGFVEQGIKHMQGVRALTLSGMELLQEQSADSKLRMWRNAISDRGASRT